MAQFKGTNPYLWKGFHQIKDLDYTDTYSPIVKSSTNRTVLLVAVNFNWKIKQLDVSNSFLDGDL